MKLSFAHIVNFVAPADNPGLMPVQELTAKTLLAAKSSTELDVHLLSAQFANARASLPTFVKPTADLVTCAADIKAMQTKKRFPLMREILVRLNECSEATHFIYTNLDIAVMPFFYDAVAGYIKNGFDAIVINRRRIPAKFLTAHDLPSMYAEAGKPHTGYDCFVFSRTILEKFILKDIFIGTPPAGNDLFYNLFTFAENPVLLTEKHLTFHAGMELYKNWGDPQLNRHNEAEFRKLLREIKPHIDITKFPGANLGFVKRHFKWLMNPTFHYPTMASVDLKQLGKTRKEKPQPEVSGSKQAYLERMIRRVNFEDGDK